LETRWSLLGTEGRKKRELKSKCMERKKGMINLNWEKSRGSEEGPPGQEREEFLTDAL